MKSMILPIFLVINGHKKSNLNECYHLLENNQSLTLKINWKEPGISDECQINHWN